VTEVGGLGFALQEVPVIGIMRGCPVEHAAAIGSAAFAGGIRVIEITLDSPQPEVALRNLIEACPALVVGAGTVRTPADVEFAVGAGASFIVTPVFSPAVVAAARSLGVPILPGASTPSEIWAALEAGAFAVKVFPARELGGPAYLKAIREPLGHPPLVPTGGVAIGDGPAYLLAGALALGVGGSVFPLSSLVDGDAGHVGSLAAEMVRSVQ
jgi:2-dehydro-3-deoxyphosphogluconate aldolase/(4S)-4-hydroxy-2-oxoglutarate aldolase